MSINNVSLMGRLTFDPELKATTSGVSVTNFTLAVDRKYTPKGQEKQADFVDCVAWDRKAEFVCNYFGKGQLMALEGSIQTRDYTDKQGNKRKAVEVLADHISFCGDKNAAQSATEPHSDVFGDFVEI